MAPSVLIVDDDRATRVGLTELLQEAEYEVTATGSFQEALRILRTHPPDLLIADVRLGSFNGIQLMISSPNPLPVILITGFADPVLETDARSRGAEYLLKPVQPAQLLELVEQKLEEAGRGSSGRPR